MLSPDDVSAVVVTKGDCDLTEIVDNLVFGEIVIWDNSCQAQPPAWWWTSKKRHVLWCGSSDQMTLGRALGADAAANEVIWSQDDDIIHSPDNQLDILAAYEPGVLTGCMWPEWSDGAREQGIPDGYDDLVFPGSGSIVDRSVTNQALARYLAHFPFDDFLRLWADTIIGILAPNRQLPIHFDALPCAEDPDRMTNLPNAVEQKTEAIRRARLVRDRANMSAKLRGSNNPMWRGGRADLRGYVRVKVGKDHSMAAADGYALEHRLVAAEILGRTLRKDEVVHHIDLDRSNNAPENLVVMDQSNHRKIHGLIEAGVDPREALRRMTA